MNPRKIELLERNFELYWSGKKTEISDERFDELLEQLRKEEPNHPLLSKLGLDVPRGIEYQHTTPMLSLNKVYDFDSLQKWVKKVSRSGKEQFLIQYKFDGLAGKLIGRTLATRGNGKIGEDISRRRADIRLVQGDFSIPLVAIPSISKPILGEIVVSIWDFERYKNCEDREFAHPRNFVAGMINRKDFLPDGVKLDFVEYSSSRTEIRACDEFLKEDGQIMWAKLIEKFNQFKQYPSDGLVIKLADRNYADSLGFTEHHPLGAIAFKFYGETVWSELLNVEWNPGKGKLTPVAIIKPVQLGGVKISRVTLHNAKFVLDRKICIGDYLEIERAGEVIPHILNRKSGQTMKGCIPNNCPVCGAPLDYKEPNLLCTNRNCQGMQFERLWRAIECFEIEGLGYTIVEHLNRLGFLGWASDIFSLKYEQLLLVPGFAEQSARKLLKNIELKKNLTPEVILTSLNTPGIGKSIYAKILEKIPFQVLINNVDFEKLAKIPRIGTTRAIAIKRSLHQNEKYLQQLLSIINVTEHKKIEGRRICFTGKMDKPRSYYQKQANERGYVPVENVTKELDLLVISSEDWISNKTKTAERLGIKIMTLEEWENEQ